MTWLRFAIPLGVLIVILSLLLLWQREAGKVDRLTGDLAATSEALERSQSRVADLEMEARERLADDTAIDKAKEELHDAIKDIPAGTAPSPATVALGCVRLRQAGATGDAFKRICGNR